MTGSLIAGVFLTACSCHPKEPELSEALLSFNCIVLDKLDGFLSDISGKGVFLN